jgi:4-hydroxy-tetrahydrodipicolinate synthase
VDSTEGRVPVIAGITGEGTEVAALEAQRAVDAGASAGLLYPPMAGCVLATKGAPQDRYRVVYEESLPLILFQYPDVTKPITSKRCWISPRNRESLR